MIEGYVCNNQKCRAYGTPFYLGEEVVEVKCPRCLQDRTELKSTEYVEPTVHAKDIMPKVSTKGFTHKMKG